MTKDNFFFVRTNVNFPSIRFHKSWKVSFVRRSIDALHRAGHQTPHAPPLWTPFVLPPPALSWSKFQFLQRRAWLKCLGLCACVREATLRCSRKEGRINWLRFLVAEKATGFGAFFLSFRAIFLFLARKRFVRLVPSRVSASQTRNFRAFSVCLPARPFVCVCLFVYVDNDDGRIWLVGERAKVRSLDREPPNPTLSANVIAKFVLHFNPFLSKIVK